MDKIIVLYMIGLVLTAFAVGQEIQWLIYTGIAILGISVIASVVLVTYAITHIGKEDNNG